MAVAAVEHGDRIGCIRLRRVPDASAPNLHAFILHAVEPGGLFRTSGWRSESQLHSFVYRHRGAVTDDAPKLIEENFPRDLSVAARLERRLLGTHQGAVKKRHLDDFTFRFNRRTSPSHGLLFYRLLEQRAVTVPVVRSRPGASP